MEKLYNVGIYTRLSVEDTANSGKAKGKINTLDRDSVSIENQRIILSKYAMLRGWMETRAYADDGYSGGNFDRPAFKQMVKDAQDGIINLILVKDLSRLGRDYIEVGRYTDEIFPALGCRFVALMDDIDTGKDDNDMMPFRSLLNDYHLKDLSKKIKSVLNAKAKSGQYLANYAPYGYRKSSDDRHKLIVDEYAAGIVKKIFELRVQKHGYARIASILNSENILSPREYLYHSMGRENPYKKTSLWRDTSVKVLLKNEIYLGHIIQHTTGSLSYKNKTQIKRPECDWIRVENTHEPIIDQQTWDAVQSISLIKYDPDQRRTPQPSLFSGMLICADCKSGLTHNSNKQTRKNGDVVRYSSYGCAYHYQTGRSVCSPHRIYEMTLKKIIIEDIKKQAGRISCDEQKVVAELRNRLSCDNEQSHVDVKKELKRIESRLTELDRLSAKLYEDKLAGQISPETFASLIANSEAERTEIEAERLRLTEAQAVIDSQLLNIENWIASIRRHMALEELDSETLRELIEKIEIGERLVVDGVKQQDIKIYYRFVGLMG